MSSPMGNMPPIGQLQMNQYQAPNNTQQQQQQQQPQPQSQQQPQQQPQQLMVTTPHPSPAPTPTPQQQQQFIQQQQQQQQPYQQSMPIQQQQQQPPVMQIAAPIPMHQHLALQNGVMPQQNGMAPPQQQQQQQQQNGIIPQQNGIIQQQNEIQSGAPIQYQQPAGPIPNNFAYINNFMNGSNNNNGSVSGPTPNTVLAGNFSVIDLDNEIKPYEQVLTEERKKELLADFEKIKSMNLLDDEEVLYGVFLNSTVFAAKEFKVASLSISYRKKYPELFDRYDSLSVYLEFCLSKIIYSSESALKNACATQNVFLPNSKNEKFMRLFGNHKRGAKKSYHSKPIQTIKHPFFQTLEFQSQPILYSIGKCCDYLIPSEFAELVAQIKPEKVCRIKGEKDKLLVDGLKITLKKPVVCLLITKTVQKYQFVSLEHLSTLGERITDMTGLGRLPDSFAFGTRVNMQVEITSPDGRHNEIKSTSKLEGAQFVAIINQMQVCKLSNYTFSSKTYASLIYSIPNAEMDPKKIDDYHSLVEVNTQKIDEALDTYEQALKVIEYAEEQHCLQQQQNGDNQPGTSRELQAKLVLQQQQQQQQQPQAQKQQRQQDDDEEPQGSSAKMQKIEELPVAPVVPLQANVEIHPTSSIQPQQLDIIVPPSPQMESNYEALNI